MELIQAGALARTPASLIVFVCAFKYNLPSKAPQSFRNHSTKSQQCRRRYSA